MHGFYVFAFSEIHDRPEIFLHFPKVFPSAAFCGYAGSVYVFTGRGRAGNLILPIRIHDRQTTFIEIPVYGVGKALTVLEYSSSFRQIAS